MQALLAAPSWLPRCPPPAAGPLTTSTSPCRCTTLLPPLPADLEVPDGEVCFVAQKSVLAKLS